MYQSFREVLGLKHTEVHQNICPADEYNMTVKVKWRLSLLTTFFVAFTESDINPDKTSDGKKRLHTPLCKNATCLTACKHGGLHVRNRVLPENFKDSGLHVWISCFVKSNSGQFVFPSDNICLVAFGLWVSWRRKKVLWLCYVLSTNIKLFCLLCSS